MSCTYGNLRVWNLDAREIDTVYKQLFYLFMIFLLQVFTVAWKSDRWKMEQKKALTAMKSEPHCVPLRDLPTMAVSDSLLQKKCIRCLLTWDWVGHYCTMSSMEKGEMYSRQSKAILSNGCVSGRDNWSAVADGAESLLSSHTYGVTLVAQVSGYI